MSDIILKNICKSYHSKVVFQDFSAVIEENTLTIITGSSGCGKSTLLNMIGLLDKPDSGTLEMFGTTNVKPFSKKAEKLLREKIGYLFQNYALIENETVNDNLMIALEYVKGEKKKMITESLEKVGLTGYENKKIYQLSGGEQQRVALARLMLKPCELVLADEPTGSLDDNNKEIVMNIIKELQNQRKTIILVTHDLSLLKYADKHIQL